MREIPHVVNFEATGLTAQEVEDEAARVVREYAAGRKWVIVRLTCEADDVVVSGGGRQVIGWRAQVEAIVASGLKDGET